MGLFDFVKKKDNTKQSNKYKLVDTFFIDQADYIKFLVSSKLTIIANDAGTCFAELSKEDNRFLYRLIWDDGKFIGDYIKPFRATQVNVNRFNKGCKILADRLNLYIDSGDINSIPSEPPAFGNLTASLD